MPLGAGIQSVPDRKGFEGLPTSLVGLSRRPGDSLLEWLLVFLAITTVARPGDSAKGCPAAALSEAA